jgi:aryl-alcohol dehydrogenase-like predicted oxidoreductase
MRLLRAGFAGTPTQRPDVEPLSRDMLASVARWPDVESITPAHASCLGRVATVLRSGHNPQRCSLLPGHGGTERRRERKTTMEYTRLGNTGLKVSRLALGCMSYGDPTTPNAHPWALTEDAALPFFQQSIELGVTFWDTANVYQLGTSEELVGRAITRYSRREDIVLATKVRGWMHDGPGGEGLSRKAILEQVDASLTRLGTDYIDLYQIHRFDPDTPVEETMEALHDIIKAGKVRYIGASSMYAWQFAKLQGAAHLGGWTRFVSMQNQYNLLRRHDERELMAMCGDMGVGLVPYSPNGKGRLARPAGEQSRRSSTDKVVQAFDSPHDEPVINAVQRLAESRGVSMAQIALAWVLRNPLVSAPIVGATKPHHLPEAVDALGLRLTDAEVLELERPYQQYGPSWY